MYAVDLGSGQLRWSSRLGGLIGGGVLVGGDTVYAASGRPEGKVYALDAHTGREVWRDAYDAPYRVNRRRPRTGRVPRAPRRSRRAGS